jgi:hypothetical protein
MMVCFGKSIIFRLYNFNFYSDSMTGVFSWINEKSKLSLLKALDIEKSEVIHLTLKVVKIFFKKS